MRSVDRDVKITSSDRRRARRVVDQMHVRASADPDQRAWQQLVAAEDERWFRYGDPLTLAVLQEVDALYESTGLEWT